MCSSARRAARLRRRLSHDGHRRSGEVPETIRVERSRRNRRIRRRSRRTRRCPCRRAFDRDRARSRALDGRRPIEAHWSRSEATSVRATGSAPTVALVQSLQVSAMPDPRSMPIVSEPVSVSWLSNSMTASRPPGPTWWFGSPRSLVMSFTSIGSPFGRGPANRSTRFAASSRPLRSYQGPCRSDRARARAYRRDPA